MTIILFLIDTSGSMNQRTYLGTTLLDIAKGAVECFMKFRSRDPASRWDRYMLLTFEDPPANVKAGWKESHATFMSELKNLQAIGLSTLGPALKHTFDLLNVNRMQSGVDTYGMGRCPFYLEPAMILCFTDGKKLTSNGGVQYELNLPMNLAVPGSELTKEPFRWDQRLFGLTLRIPATPPMESMSPFIPSADDAAIDAMCEVTGGRSYAITSHRMMMQCIESLVQKVISGVVINFEKIGPDPAPVSSEDQKVNGVEDTDKDTNGSKENQDLNKQEIAGGLLCLQMEEKKRASTPTLSNQAWHTCRKLIYVQRSAQKGYSVGHWPIPEAFWPDNNSPTLPPRTAHPVVKFSCTPCEPMVIENLPFDKYELEPSPLTQYILERRQPNVCWQVFVTNSAKYSDIGHPFGYMKASTNLQCVNLFVMPYNYPVLLPLLAPFHQSLAMKGNASTPNHVHPHWSCDYKEHFDWTQEAPYDLFKVHKLKPTQKWRQQFENYLKTMPTYYAAPLRRALARMGVPNLVPDNMDNSLSYSVLSYLKKLKNQAKMEYERLVASVGQKLTQEGIKVTSRCQTSILQRKDFNQLLQHYGGDMSHLKQELTDYNSFMIAVPDKFIKTQSYRNPFDIARQDLLDQVARMRANFLRSSMSGAKLVDEDQLHSIPVQQMGNYQEYLKKMAPPLRELETQPTRLHTFGNPFKVNKNLMIDEADEAMPGQARIKRTIDSPPTSPGPRKRKPGPLPRDVPVWKLISPPASPSPQDMESPPSSPVPGLIIDITAPDKDGFDMELGEPVEVNHRDQVTNHINAVGPGDDLLPGPVSQGYSDVADRSEAPYINNKKQSIVAKEHNTKLRVIVYKEIKKPGKNYENLFNHLNTVQGTLDTRCLFVQDAIREAHRFKKKVLVQMLEQYEQSMIKTDFNNKKHKMNAANQKSPSR